jgi:hypothetical protein
LGASEADGSNKAEDRGSITQDWTGQDVRSSRVSLNAVKTRLEELRRQSEAAAAAASETNAVQPMTVTAPQAAASAGTVARKASKRVMRRGTRPQQLTRRPTDVAQVGRQMQSALDKLDALL